MVQLPFGKSIGLDGRLPYFEPRNRFAILINGWEEHKVDETVWNPFCRGAYLSCELEALLTGNITTFKTEASREYFKRESECYRKRRTRIPYSVVSIAPPCSIEDELTRTCEEIGSKSTYNTLTLVYLVAHGVTGRFSFGERDWMSYQRLLETLEQVKGKKAIVALCCYSGTLIDFLNYRDDNSDYVVITSSSSDEIGLSSSDDKIHRRFADALKKRRKVSHIRLPQVLKRHDKMDIERIQHPRIVGYYDIVL